MDQLEQHGYLNRSTYNTNGGDETPKQWSRQYYIEETEA
jgi:hypothetical protein